MYRFALKRRLLFMAVTSFLLVSFTVKAQRYNLSVYNVSNGMPGNQINEIIQDHNGRLWVGTMNGVTVYDGTGFSNFDKNNPISNNPVKTVFQDSKGNMWIGMIRKGVCKYDGTSFEFFNSSNGLLSDNVNAVTEDADGDIWIGTSEGLNRYDGKKLHSYTNLRGLVNNNVFSLLFDSKGLLWITTIGGISTFDGTNFTNYTTDQGLLSNICYHIMEAKNGLYWISTYLGISIYDGSSFKNISASSGLISERVEKIIQNNEDKIMFASYGGGVGTIEDDTIFSITVNEGLPSNIIKTLIQDREGNYWIGTWNGLCKYKGNRFVTFTVEDGLNNNNILSIASDSSGIIWMGTLTGGVNYFDGKSLQSLGLESGLRSSTIWSIFIDNKEGYWFGTTNGPALLNLTTYQFTHPYPFFDNLIIYTIIKDKKGRLMLGTDKGIYIRNDKGEFINIGKTEGLENDKVRVLFEDRDGKVWVGTLKGTYYLQNDTAYNFNHTFELPGAPVTSIIQDSTGNIITSTYDFGIYAIMGPGPDYQLRILNKTNGLYNDRVLFNFLDQNQNMWLGSPSGIDWIDWRKYLATGTLDVNHFDKSNGYLGIESNAACSDNNGNVWFATVNGVIKYNIKAGINRNSIPLLRLVSIQLAMENVDWRKKQLKINKATGLPEDLVLAYNNNHLGFSYSGVYLTAPEELRYQVMLEGFENNWSPPTRQTLATFSNLSPGTYTFKVKASANGRTWSNPVTYTFTIKPPYWKTPFFYFLYAVGVIGSVFLFLRLRTRSLQRTQNMLRQKVEQRTRELNQKNLELEKLSIVASETDNAVLIFNENKEIEWANTGFTKMTGYTVSEIEKLRGNKISDFTFNPDVEKIIAECIVHKTSTVFESQIPCSNGHKIWASSTLTPIFNNSGLLKKIVVINTDITYRKKMEEQIRESLEEKGLLLREIHHRVKNNLQIIISLFNLQSHYVSDLKASEALKEGQDRIKSMALIHERFYQNEGLSRIDFDDYIRRLIENLYMSFNVSPDRIKPIIDAEKISLDIDTAVPCGLIINELISNSLKHAFAEDDKGEIRISFSRLDDHHLQLIISDNGKGMPAGFDFENADTLGMQLISALSNQLDGKLELLQGPGTTFSLLFKSEAIKSDKINQADVY